MRRSPDIEALKLWKDRSGSTYIFLYTHSSRAYRQRERKKRKNKTNYSMENYTVQGYIQYIRIRSCQFTSSFTWHPSFGLRWKGHLCLRVHIYIDVVYKGRFRLRLQRLPFFLFLFSPRQMYYNIRLWMRVCKVLIQWRGSKRMVAAKAGYD